MSAPFHSPFASLLSTHYNVRSGSGARSNSPATSSSTLLGTARSNIFHQLCAMGYPPSRALTAVLSLSHAEDDGAVEAAIDIIASDDIVSAPSTHSDVALIMSMTGAPLAEARAAVAAHPNDINAASERIWAARDLQFADESGAERVAARENARAQRTAEYARRSGEWRRDEATGLFSFLHFNDVVQLEHVNSGLSLYIDADNGVSLHSSHGATANTNSPVMRGGRRDGVSLSSSPTRASLSSLHIHRPKSFSAHRKSSFTPSRERDKFAFTIDKSEQNALTTSDDNAVVVSGDHILIRTHSDSFVCVEADGSLCANRTAPVTTLMEWILLEDEDTTQDTTPLTPISFDSLFVLHSIEKNYLVVESGSRRLIGRTKLRSEAALWRVRLIQRRTNAVMTSAMALPNSSTLRWRWLRTHFRLIAIRLLQSTATALTTDIRNKRRMMSRRAEEDDVCSVCLDKTNDTVLLECGHICVCHECAPALTVCPIDRRNITRVIRIAAD